MSAEREVVSTATPTARRLRVLAWVPQPTDTSPGQRFRIEQWDPWLRREGIDITYSPFADAELSACLKRRGALLSKAVGVLRSLARRVREALAAPGYDAVYVFREGALLGPALAERLLARSGVPYFYDFDDAVWVRYVSPANAYLSYLRFPGKTAGLCRRAWHVFAGNALLRDYALQYNQHVSVVPTTIDTDKYRPLPPRVAQPPVLGWTGSYSSEPYLELLRPALEALAGRHTFKLVVVGGGRFSASVFPVEHRPWRAETELSDLSDFDVGLMPLADTEWERGKCGLKALQYMALGVPTVVSPVGVNAEIVSDGRNGLHARSAREWELQLGRLLGDRELRRRLGAEGRRTVEESYSASVHARRVAERLWSVRA